MAPKSAPALRNPLPDAYIDKDRGELVMGELRLDLRILEAIAIPDSGLLFRFYLDDGCVKLEIVQQNADADAVFTRTPTVQ